MWSVLGRIGLFHFEWNIHWQMCKLQNPTLLSCLLYYYGPRLQCLFEVHF